MIIFIEIINHQKTKTGKDDSHRSLSAWNDFHLHHYLSFSGEFSHWR